MPLWDLARSVLAVLTVGVLTVVFATTNGENIQSVAVPVALVYAGWWAVGPLLALAWARPAPIAVAIWVLSLAISLFLLFGLYDSTSSTSGIGLLTIPVGVAAANVAVVAVSRVLSGRDESSART